MNTKELEALVLQQGALIQALEARIQTDPIPALAELVQKLSADIGQLKGWIGADQSDGPFYPEFKALSATVSDLIGQITTTQEAQHEMRGHQDGMNDTLFGAVGRIEEVEKLVRARNSSAATKRNMVDADALRVLTGDLKDLSHKDAAEQIGLTYAQVYSSRLEFTFKHIHKHLRDDVEGWKNPWTK